MVRTPFTAALFILVKICVGGWVGGYIDSFCARALISGVDTENVKGGARVLAAGLLWYKGGAISLCSC